jgi:type II secretory pathway pseudopilin PulG
MGRLSSLGESVASLAKRAGKGAAEDAARAAAKEAAEAAAEAAAKRAMRDAGEEAGEAAAKRAAKDAGEETAEAAAKRAKETSRLSDAFEACKRNKKACAAGVAGTTLVAYTAATYASASTAQKTCIAQCLPENWDGPATARPRYRTERATRDQPRCTSGDCDAYCKRKCEFEHPTTAAGHVAKAVRDAAEDVVDAVRDALDGALTSLATALGVDLQSLRRGVLLALVLLVVKYVVLPAVELAKLVAGRDDTNVRVVLRQNPAPAVAAA